MLIKYKQTDKKIEFEPLNKKLNNSTEYKQKLFKVCINLLIKNYLSNAYQKNAHTRIFLPTKIDRLVEIIIKWAIDAMENKLMGKKVVDTLFCQHRPNCCLYYLEQINRGLH